MIPRGRGGNASVPGVGPITGGGGRGAVGGVIAESQLHSELNKQVEEKKWQKLEWRLSEARLVHKDLVQQERDGDLE